MKEFAKIFNTDNGQILALNDTNEKGCPSIKVYGNPSGLGVCNVEISFPDTDEGCDDCDTVFRKLTEEMTYEIAKPIFEFCEKLECD